MDDNSRKKPDPKDLNAIQRFYEHFRWIPLKFLDLFIGVCISALLLVLIAGFFNRAG